MEGQLVWKDEYNIGIDIIDKEHERLFKIINKLFRFTDEKSKSQWACQEGIKFFKDHAAKHFTEEEEYMASMEYERLGMRGLRHTGTFIRNSVRGRFRLLKRNWNRRTTARMR